jgi:hypothetical protein
MEEVCPSETLVATVIYTMSEGRNLIFHRRETPKLKT